jgi:Helix-turn-helix domain
MTDVTEDRDQAGPGRAGPELSAAGGIQGCSGRSCCRRVDQPGIELVPGSWRDARSRSRPCLPSFPTQDDRIAIADGLQAGTGVKQIAASIGKSFQTIYREIGRNSKPDGCYQPWWAHNRFCAGLAPKTRSSTSAKPLRALVLGKLARKWSPSRSPGP